MAAEQAGGSAVKSGQSTPVQNAPRQIQPTPAPNNSLPTATPANTPNLQNPPNTVNPANNAVNQAVNGAVTDPNQINSPTALTGSGVLNTAGGAPVLTDIMLARLQSDSANRKQVTLTGRIMDVQTFFLGGIFGNAPNIVGQPISAAQNNVNAAAGANALAPNASSGVVTPGANSAATNPPANTVRQAGAPNLATQNQTQVVTPPPPGNVPNLAQPGTPVAPNNNVPLQVSSLGQMMVLQTNSGALLVAQDPLAVASFPLSATATPVTVQGRIYERAGMRLMLVSAVNVPGGAPGAAPSGATGNINSPNNNLRNQATPRTNRQTR